MDGEKNKKKQIWYVHKSFPFSHSSNICQTHIYSQVCHLHGEREKKKITVTKYDYWLVHSKLTYSSGICTQKKSHFNISTDICKAGCFWKLHTIIKFKMPIASFMQICSFKTFTITQFIWLTTGPQMRTSNTQIYAEM